MGKKQLLVGVVWQGGRVVVSMSKWSSMHGCW